MDVNNQKQMAGDNSSQIIANNITIVNGISEERVRAIMVEIFQERNSQLILEARQSASERVNELADKVIPKMIEYDEKLEFLKEPSVQRAILTAQKSASCTDNKEDLDILSDLLMDRIKNRNDRKTRFNYDKAMEVVDQIPEESLTLLSMMTLLSMGMSKPQWLTLSIFFNDFESKVKQLIGETPLTNDASWIEPLDSLSLIRSFPKGINGFIPFVELLSLLFPSIFAKGIQINSQRYDEIKIRLEELNMIPGSVLIPHPFIDGHAVAIHPMVMISNKQSSKLIKKADLTEEQFKYFSSIEDEINKPTPHDEEVKAKIMEFIIRYPTLRAVSEWWNSIPYGFEITSIGRLIGTTTLKLRLKNFFTS